MLTLVQITNALQALFALSALKYAHFGEFTDLNFSVQNHWDNPQNLGLQYPLAHINPPSSDLDYAGGTVSYSFDVLFLELQAGTKTAAEVFQSLEVLSRPIMANVVSYFQQIGVFVAQPIAASYQFAITSNEDLAIVYRLTLTVPLTNCPQYDSFDLSQLPTEYQSPATIPTKDVENIIPTP